MERHFKPWSMTECDGCGTEFQVTRIEGRTFSGAVVCESCESYAMGFADAIKKAADIVSSSSGNRHTVARIASQVASITQ